MLAGNCLLGLCGGNNSVRVQHERQDIPKTTTTKGYISNKEIQ